MTYNIMVEIPASEFLRTRRGLVRLLEAIKKAGDSGITTRELCYKVFTSRDSFCVKQLEFAEEQGYITREVVPVGGRGHPYTINKITNKGSRLLAEIRRASR
jgi:CTP-dependent riboflavin kinase